MPGLWFEQFTVDQVIAHHQTITITQQQNAEYCNLTLNTQPLHLDEAAAKKAGFPTFLVNGLLTFSLAVGLSVKDTTEGTLIANLGYEKVRHPAPVFPGDKLRVSTRVVSKRASSKPGRGLVTLEHSVTNQDAVLVCQFERTVMVRMEEK